MFSKGKCCLQQTQSWSSKIQIRGPSDQSPGAKCHQGQLLPVCCYVGRIYQDIEVMGWDLAIGECSGTLHVGRWREHELQSISHIPNKHWWLCLGLSVLLWWRRKPSEDVSTECPPPKMPTHRARSSGWDSTLTGDQLWGQDSQSNLSDLDTQLPLDFSDIWAPNCFSLLWKSLPTLITLSFQKRIALQR